MELLQGVEIYIPPEAEVKSVPLLSLSSSVRRKMGLSAGLDALPHSALCVCITPALFHTRGLKEPPQGPGARQHVLHMLGKSRADCPTLTKGYGQCKLTIVTAHSTAYRVLKETLTVAGGPHTPVCSSTSVPQGMLSDTEQDAVIVHQGRVYLSVKKVKKQVGHGPPTGQVAAVAHNPLKRKRESQPTSLACGHGGAPQSQKSQRAPQTHSASVGPGQTHSASVGPGQNLSASVGPGQNLGASVWPGQSHGASVRSGQSHGASVGPGQSHGASVGNRSPEPAEESQSVALQSIQQSHTESWGPLELLARHGSGQSESDIDYEELATRERIAQRLARLQRNQ